MFALNDFWTIVWAVVVAVIILAILGALLMALFGFAGCQGNGLFNLGGNRHGGKHC